MQRILINRISLSFINDGPLFIVLKANDNFCLNKNRAGWIKGKLPKSDADKLYGWMDEKGINDSDKLQTIFTYEFPEGNESDFYCAELNAETSGPFIKELLKQKLGEHLKAKGFFVNPIKIPLDFCAYQKVSTFNKDYEQFRRIDFLWNPARKELSFNFGSEKTLISRATKVLNAGDLAFDENTMLAYPCDEGTHARTMIAWEDRRRLIGTPKPFSYKDRYEILKEFAVSNLYDFNSRYFKVDKTGFKNIEPDDYQSMYNQQNLMVFGNDKTAINAVIGMREYGPLRKAKNAEKKRLLFIYQNRNDANTLYRYLKNGYKHFPGLLSYVGIPVALAEAEKGLSYNDAKTLPEQLPEFLDENYPDAFYPDTLAIIIGPFKKYESDEAESTSYYQIKKILLEKGIASQFVGAETLNSSGIHYSLPNIAIAILAKCGGIPWKLIGKASNELIVGFNTKLVDEDQEQYLGSAVFFDNEGKMGGIKGLPISSKESLIGHLKSAIENYTSEFGAPDRLVIHYYKPPGRSDIRNILNLLEDMSLSIPVAVVEVNDSKSKLDICFDADYGMGMPESGVFVKVGFNEYLLFNNNRYQKSPPRKIDDELPIKLKLSYVKSGGFNTTELISQVYEFSRLNWKGLRQRSVPVTTTYSKTIAEFASHFDGEIPENDVANNIPWFI